LIAHGVDQHFVGLLRTAVSAQDAGLLDRVANRRRSVDPIGAVTIKAPMDTRKVNDAQAPMPWRHRTGMRGKAISADIASNTKP
jgi:hypothetical protein